jgi:hypothetical protein
MRPPRVRRTVGRVMVASAIVIAGSLVVGSMSRLPAAVTEADALVFGVSYATELGLGIISVVRYIRQVPRPRLRPNFAAMLVLAVTGWATIEWPIVQGWAYHAQCERLYRDDPLLEQDQTKRREQIALHSRLRQAHQPTVFRPWHTATDP